MAVWAVPAALAVAGAMQGRGEARRRQSDALNQRNLYAAMYEAGYGAQVPGGGVVGRPPSQTQGMFAGALQGGLTGLGVMGIAKNLGMWKPGSGTQTAAAPAPAGLAAEPEYVPIGLQAPTPGVQSYINQPDYDPTGGAGYIPGAVPTQSMAPPAPPMAMVQPGTKNF